MINVSELTHDYGHGRGVFDISFDVNGGETLGFLGPNGAGKSTTMRHLMGFSKPQKGTVSIAGLDCTKQSRQIMEKVGYLPGEVALPEGLTGRAFIKMMQDMRGVKDGGRTEELLERFELDPSGNVKRMSIGEKRKLAIVAAFMSDPEILLLDEPTSGLDPVMQEEFISFIREEKQKGKTILLSSHIFSEVEALCDRIAIVKEGRLVSSVDAADVRHGLHNIMTLEFEKGCAIIIKKESVSMHNAQCTMHNEGIAFGDVMSIRTFNLTIFPKISDFAALTSPNGHDVGAADTSIVHCAL